MSAALPQKYIDKKTGVLRRLQSPRDYFLTETLPDIAHLGILGLKTAVAYSFFGPLALAIPAASYVMTRQSMLYSGTKEHDKHFSSPVKSDGVSQRFHLSNAEDRARFTRSYGRHQPKLMMDVLHMTRSLGMKELPMIEVIDPVDFGRGKAEKKLVNMYAGVATISRPDGKKPVLVIGAGAMQSVQPDEMRTIIAHEMTHAKLNHTRQNYLHIARRAANGALNLMLLATAVLGPLPLLPVIGFAVVTNIAQHTIENVRSRRREHLCDQGAALITGQTKEFISGLDKISRALAYANTALINRERLRKGQPPASPQEPGSVTKFFLATHPDKKSRFKRVAAFGQKFPDFCAQQKSGFAQAFAQAAAKKKTPPVQNPALRRVI